MTKKSGMAAIIEMRDEFIGLVTVYNTVGLYEQAHDAQAMAIMLHKFENSHNLAEVAWPPDVVETEEGFMIADMEGRGIGADEL